MRCPECNGSGEAIYYVEIGRDEVTVTVAPRNCVCRTCNGSGKKPMTNADRIRAMSDEELADFMNKEHDYCNNWPKCMEMLDTDELIPDNWCKGCLIKWLQKPVAEPTLPVRFHLDKQESGLVEEG